MANLIDALNQEVTSKRNQRLIGGGSAAERLIKARGGKSVESEFGPRKTNLAEAMAAQRAQGAISDVAAEADMAARAQREQEAGLLQGAEMQRRELEANRELAQLEQQAQSEALQNKEYLATLDRVGRERLLTQGILDQEKLTRAQLGASTDVLRRALGDAWITGTQKIDLDVAQKKLEGQWDIDLQGMLDSAQNYAQTTEALGKIIEGGTKLYAAYDKKNP